ncbi:MAG: hypothetical protein RL701_305 [Pseudomonadota bacterium]|jgi:regulator of ribonuclease activity A
MTWTTSDLYDAHGEALQVALPVFKSFGGRARFSGAIETVRCHEDNSRVKEQLATDGGGRVLVVDGSGSLRCALLGDLIAASAVKYGWAGVIIHGAVRDVDALEKMELGVYALGSVPRKSVRRDEGQVGPVVSFAGVVFEPGAYLYADQTGIVVARERITEEA